MFVMDVKKNIATITDTEPMTHGSSNVYLVQFHFSEEWNELSRIAVFKSGDIVVDVLLDESNLCFMPWEVLTEYGRPVQFGVYGTMHGNVVLPTIWASTEVILEGVVTGAEAQPPSPSLYDQILDRLNELEINASHSHTISSIEGLQEQLDRIPEIMTAEELRSILTTT